MTAAGAKTINLYPEQRDCPSPSAARVLDIFAGVTRHRLYQHGHLAQVFEPDLDDRQRSVLRLLEIPASVYQLTS